MKEDGAPADERLDVQVPRRPRKERLKLRQQPPLATSPFHRRLGFDGLMQAIQIGVVRVAESCYHGSGSSSHGPKPPPAAALTIARASVPVGPGAPTDAEAPPCQVPGRPTGQEPRRSPPELLTRVNPRAIVFLGRHRSKLGRRLSVQASEVPQRFSSGCGHAGGHFDGTIRSRKRTVTMSRTTDTRKAGTPHPPTRSLHRDRPDHTGELGELVTGAEIGRRLGVSRERVRQWAADPRYQFPAPLGRIGRAVVWRWGDIAAWVQQREPGARQRGT